MAFTSLAFVVLLGVIGVMAGNLYFWIAFTLFHVLFCMFMTVQIYYLGRWRLGLFFNKCSVLWLMKQPIYLNLINYDYYSLSKIVEFFAEYIIPGTMTVWLVK